MRKELSQIRTIVVLVEPSGPLNVGSVARLCANFGIDELRLVRPHCNPNDPNARKMAVKGLEFLETATNFSSLLDAIQDCRRVVATCGRLDHGNIPLEDIEQTLPWLLDASEEESIALVFGREDRGLTNQELEVAQRVITLQSSKKYPSLNLSHAVAIVLHELEKFKFKKSSDKPERIHLKPASPKQLNDCLEDAQSLLLEVGFLLEHTAEARMSKVRGLLHRANIRPEEVALIRGMSRQLRWAIQSKRS